MALNKGYLTAKTDKASDEYFTPRYAVDPIIKHSKTDLRPLFCLTQILLKGNVDLESIKNIYNKVGR